MCFRLLLLLANLLTVLWQRQKAAASFSQLQSFTYQLSFHFFPQKSAPPPHHPAICEKPRIMKKIKNQQLFLFSLRENRQLPL